MPCGSSKDSNHSDKNGENRHCAFEDLDHSILQHPLYLGSNNVKQILKCMQNASKEVKDIILNECNIIYECKICANLFRSLANFLYHKRCYCKKHLCEDMALFENYQEETETIVVQPEPPTDKNSVKSSGEIPLKNCTVKLVKTDVQGKNMTTTPTEEPKNLRNKGIKGRDQLEDDGKKMAKTSKIESPMISRRTREKNSRNASKRALRDAVDNDPPKKASKSTNKFSATSKSCNDDVEKLATAANEPVIEYLKEVRKSRKVEINKPEKEENNKPEKEGTGKPEKEETVKPKKEETGKPEKEETGKPEEEQTGKPEEEQTGKPEEEQTGKPEEEESGNLRIETSKSEKEVTGKEETINLEEESSKSQKAEIDIPMAEETNKIRNDDNYKSEMETNAVMLSPEEDMNKLTSEIVDINVDEELESNQASINEVTKEIECIKPSETTLRNPLKKIIITKPKSLDAKNSTVLSNIQKNMKATNKIGFTKITNATGKSLQCFPKIIFKTIDGNPHAVFQTTDRDKSDRITLKTKLENSAVSNKSEKDKLIIVLKKESNISASADSKETSTKTVKVCKNQSEFHLTRRKRLLARNDCNVQDLRCLTCNTQFTSLKTLYFHMLSIHSKKRLYYPCPFCKTLFVQMYGVTRHLITIHNKTKEQINKLRDVIKKKSIWKKVDDASLSDEISSPRRIEEVDIKEEPKREIKSDTSISTKNTENSTLKTVIKLNKNAAYHQCSKCGRVFGRKSSQVSHEKFCIMNAIKAETVDLAGGNPISPPPNVSFLSLSPKPVMTDPHFHKPVQTIQNSSDIKISARPKRGAEKQMHKDFVNSQTLKWRSANRVDTNVKAAQSVKKSNAKTLEKKVMNIMDVDNLLCMKCKKVFSSFSNLRRHVAIHVGWTRFKCKYCDYQAYNKSQCWGHVQKVHAVNDEDLEKSIVSLNKTTSGRKAASNLQNCFDGKRTSDTKIKQIPTKANGIPKVKISQKKVTKNYSRLSSDKKTIPAVKKGNLDKKMKFQAPDEKKDISYIKKDKIQHTDSKKEINETKKEKNQNLDSKKINIDARREKNQPMEIKDVSGIKKDKNIILENKVDTQVIKRDRTHSIGPVFKCSIPDYKKDVSNYKSVTTNNPTTIILSKKFSAPTVQSFVTVSPETLSSTKTFPLRSSPRKIEIKAPEEKKMTTLVTRSTAYSKGGPLQIKMSIKPPSDEDFKKSVTQPSEKTFAKKDRLISEWFPKKDLNSNNVRRESAPLIIGLVPATNSENKNLVFSNERNSS